MNPPELISCCPGCESPQIIPRSNPDRPANERWLCPECGTEFDRPIQRDPRPQAAKNPLKGLAKRLWDMDPDEVGGRT